MIAGGLGLLGGLFSMGKGKKAMDNAFNPYSTSAIAQGQSQQKAGYQRLLDRASVLQGREDDLYSQGQEFFDIGSQRNQLMRRSLMDQSMDAIALQNQLAQRNPNVNSGILQARSEANQLAAQGQANQQFLQGYQQMQGLGGGLLGQSRMLGQQGVGMQMGALGGMQGLSENVMQAQIANQNLANQRAAANASYYNNLATGLFGLGTNLIGQGVK